MIPVPERLPFTFHTHTGSPTGYAETATLIFRSLVEEGVEVHYLCLHDDVIYESPSYDLLVNYYRNVEPEDEPIQVMYGIAPMFYGNSGQYKVGWTMMEVDGINKRWVRACNRMDEVWVPTQYGKEAFVASGVRSLVRVVPLGIDTKQFKPTFCPMIYHGDHDFRFLAVGWWQLRKRWDLLMIAFAEEFGNESNVGLVCKVMSEAGPDDITDQIHSWIGHRMDDQIALIEGGLPWWEYVGLMRACHAFVLPTSGEGYGCPPLQALACGLPVIVTDCMGTGEVLRYDDGPPFPGVAFIPAEMEPTKVAHQYYAGANWWVPDVKALRAAMRDVYENYADWKAAALKGSGAVHTLRSGNVAARAVKSELRRIYEGL